MKHDWCNGEDGTPFPLVVYGVATTTVCMKCGMTRVRMSMGGSIYVHPDGDTVTHIRASDRGERSKEPDCTWKDDG